MSGNDDFNDVNPAETKGGLSEVEADSKLSDLVPPHWDHPNAIKRSNTRKKKSRAQIQPMNYLPTTLGGKKDKQAKGKGFPFEQTEKKQRKREDAGFDERRKKWLDGEHKEHTYEDLKFKDFNKILQSVSTYSWYKPKTKCKLLWTKVRGAFVNDTTLIQHEDECESLLFLIHQITSFGGEGGLHVKDIFSFMTTKDKWGLPTCDYCIFFLEKLIMTHFTLTEKFQLKMQDFVGRAVDVLAEYAEDTSPSSPLASVRRVDNDMEKRLKLGDGSLRVQTWCCSREGVNKEFKKMHGVFVGHLLIKNKLIEGAGDNFFTPTASTNEEFHLLRRCTIVLTTLRFYSALLQAALPRNVIKRGTAPSIASGEELIKVLKGRGIRLDKGSKDSSVFGRPFTIYSTDKVQLPSYNFLKNKFINGGGDGPLDADEDVINHWKSFFAEWSRQLMRGIAPEFRSVLKLEMQHINRIQEWQDLLQNQIIVLLGALAVGLFNALFNKYFEDY